MTKISLTLNDLTLDQAAGVVSFLNGGTIAAPKAAETAKAEPTPKVASPKTAATKPAPVAKAAPAETKAAPVKATPATPSAPEGYEPVRQAILAATAAGHRKSVKDILAEYEANSGQDLDSTVYEEVLAKLNVVMNGEVDDLA